MNEAVAYILYKEGKVLIEFRVENGREEILVTGGGVEDFDENGKGIYHENAMHREMSEELAGGVYATEYTYIGHVVHEVTGTKFHLYVLTSWRGTIPTHTIELGIHDGRLEWLELNDAIERDGNGVRKKALQKVKEHVAKKEKHTKQPTPPKILTV